MGVGFGAGMGFGNMMAASMQGQNMGGAQHPPQATIEALAPNSPAVRLAKLKDLLDAGLISQDEFNSKRAQILSEI